MKEALEAAGDLKGVPLSCFSTGFDIGLSRTSLSSCLYCVLLSLLSNFHPTDFIYLIGFILLCPWLTITSQSSTVSRYCNSKCS